MNDIEPVSDHYDAATVDQGIQVLSGLVNTSELRDVLVAFRTDLEFACRRIQDLGHYKRLHDLFQQLNDRYRLIEQDRRYLTIDDMAWDRLAMHEPDLAATIDSLLQAAADAKLAAEETLWTHHLAAAKAELRLAIEVGDQALLKRAVARITRTLSNEPSTISTRLVTVASTLRLNAITTTMEAVKANLPSARLDQSVSLRLSSGIQSMLRLGTSLSQQVARHNAWQAMENELRRVEADLERSLDELELAWPDLQFVAVLIYDDSEADWVQSLKSAADQLDAALSLGNPAQARRSFVRYRSQAGRFFNQVDYKLLGLCGELQRIAERLSELLQDPGLSQASTDRGTDRHVHWQEKSPAPPEMGLSEMRHVEQQLVELQRSYGQMTKRIAALDADIGQEIDGVRLQILQERRRAMADERERTMAELSRLEALMLVN